MDKKTWIMTGVVVVLVAVAAFAIVRSMGSGSQSETQSNINDLAKSIDHTNADTPSVPAEQIARGRSGPMKGRTGR